MIVLYYVERIDKMKSKLLGVGITVLMLGGGFLAAQGQANETKVYIPGSDVRREVARYYEENTGEELTEELPTVSQMEAIEGEFSISGSNSGYPERSLEGLQYLKNVDTMILEGLPDLIDYRPIGEMTGLKYLQMSYSGGSDYVVGNSDLSFVENLNELRVFVGSQNVSLDMTPLSGLEKLEKINLGGTLTSDSKLPISRDVKTVSIGNPIAYSTQFENNFNENISVSDGDATVSGENIFVADIPEGTEALEFYFNASAGENQEFVYNLQYIVELNWY